MESPAGLGTRGKKQSHSCGADYKGAFKMKSKPNESTGKEWGTGFNQAKQNQLDSEEMMLQQLREIIERNVDEEKATGDIQTMLAALWNKVENPELTQDADKRPPGYRSKRLIKRIAEILGTTEYDLFRHKILLRWGATAIRGEGLSSFKPDIANFITIVNQLPSEKGFLEKAFAELVKFYYEKRGAKLLAPINIPSADPPQLQILRALAVHSGGEVQQNLVYICLEMLHEENTDIAIKTKHVYAGDSQSNQHGDVIIEDLATGRVLVAYEVKAKKVTLDEYKEVVSKHGEERYYPLFIVCNGWQFNLAEEGVSYKDVYVVNLADFVVTLLGEYIAKHRISGSEAVQKLLRVYNERFQVRFIL
ncbi:hypothetical protein YIM73518_24290 [Thermus brockianus]